MRSMQSQESGEQLAIGEDRRSCALLAGRSPARNYTESNNRLYRAVVL